MSLAKNVEFLRRLPKLNGFNGLGGLGRSLRPPVASPLVEVAGFGANPGDLRMFAYLPENLPAVTQSSSPVPQANGIIAAAGD